MLGGREWSRGQNRRRTFKADLWREAQGRGERGLRGRGRRDAADLREGGAGGALGEPGFDGFGE